MTTRNRTVPTATRGDDTKQWPQNELEPSRPRQTMATTQRHNIEQKSHGDGPRRHHTSSRVVDSTSALDSAHRKHSSRHHTGSAAPSNPYGTSAQSQNHVASGATPVATSRSRHATDDYHTYAKRQTEKRSPRSSNERIAFAEEPKASKSPAHSRSGYPPAPTAQGSASTQTHWLAPPQVTSDFSASRHQRDRDRDKERERERRRAEKERSKDMERVKEKDRDQDRRRDKERDKERSSRDPGRQREKEKSKDREGRKRDEYRSAERANSAALQASSSLQTAQRVLHTDDRPPTGRLANQPSQSSYSYALDQTSIRAVPGASTAAVQSETVSYGGQHPSHSSAQVRAHDRERSSSRPHRSHRDRLAGPNGQDSGMSSSEQEQSTRERLRSSERRHATRDYNVDGQPSGPSGSETERGSIRERRKVNRLNTDASGHARVVPTNETSSKQMTSYPVAVHQDAAITWGQQARSASHSRESPRRLAGNFPLPGIGAQAHFVGLSQTQPTVPVGPISQRYIPQIVSIRAGQGPADPQTPVMLPKSSSTPTINRAQEILPLDQVSHEVIPRSVVTNQPYNSYTPDAPPAGNLHPVQQAIRSVEGIVRPSSSAARRAATTGPPTMSAPNYVKHQYQEQPYASRTSLEERVHVGRPGVQDTAVDGGQHGQLEGQAAMRTAQNLHADASRSPAPLYSGMSPTDPQYASYSASHGSLRRKASASKATIAPPGSDSLFTGANVSSAHSATISVQYAAGPQANGQVFDPRSPKSSIVPPPTVMVAQATFSPAPHSAPPVMQHQEGFVGQSPARYAQSALAHAAPTGYSPSRRGQMVSHSPGMPNVIPPGSTPRQSASARLHSQRNGSNDTIAQSPAPRPSPPMSASQQPTMNPSSSAHSHVNTSRPDTTPSRQHHDLTSGYPEPVRYRSPASSTYPNGSAYPAVLTQSQSSNAYPSYASRSATHPTASSAPSDNAETQRGAFITGQQSRAGPDTAQHPEYAPRVQDHPVGPSPMSTTGSHRMPPRSAPSPSPTITGRQQYAFPSPGTRSPQMVPSSPAPVRSNTFTPATRRPDPTPLSGPGHTRTASEPQYSTVTSRAASSNGVSAHAKSRSDSRAVSGTAHEQDLLLTPSSLAPSMLPRQPSTASTAMPAVSQSTKEKSAKDARKRGGFFSLFRSRSSPPKRQEEQTTKVTPSGSRPAEQQRPRKVSAPVISSVQHVQPSYAQASPNQTSYVRSPSTQASYMHTTPTQAQFMQLPPDTQVTNGSVKYAAPNGVQYASTAGRDKPRETSSVHRYHAPPTATPAQAPSRMFTPFRLLSKHHRTVSAASVEAEAGTAANTVITGAGSTRSSTAGRLSPPLRDPMLATQDWRNKEEAEFADRGTWRRRRPGVTFDLEDELTELSAEPSTVRPPRKSSRRPSQNED
ncbi:uncharacterized protein FIBRA_04451 [Fibroporia radiculosa]|uniref:Uncharacterized protein n=1 Tax=Fibroporia radiculosa TaxID=599839 RepID=J4IA62_9APHY|nr:uncharacterized protein FIBRA_04451 [Fibroporia radiculosa]CCM02356.1 predicted protein [Fibroporia radiculosa]